jgi:hypothetical protein
MFAMKISMTRAWEMLQLSIFIPPIIRGFKAKRKKKFFASLSRLHRSLSFNDKLDSTRMENFVHKFTRIYDLFSVSALNIYHRRY